MATVATNPAEITAVAQASGRARRTPNLGGPGVVIVLTSLVHSPASSLRARRAPPGIGFDGGALFRCLDRTRPHRANLRDRLSGGHAAVYQVGREQGAGAAKASGTVNHHPLA